MKSRVEIAKHIASLCSGTWNKNYVSSKIKTDPLYEGVYEEMRESDLPLLDIGSGMAILAMYLYEKEWAKPIAAVDYDQRKVDDGNKLLEAGGYEGITLDRCDAREYLPEHAGNVTILDILQFFTDEDQRDLLKRAAELVSAGGKLVIRSGIKESNVRFFVTWLGDMVAKCSFWMKAAPTHYPTPETFRSVLEPEGFDVEIRPFWGKTPFNNYLIVAVKRDTSAGMA